MLVMFIHRSTSCRIIFPPKLFQTNEGRDNSIKIKTKTLLLLSISLHLLRKTIQKNIIQLTCTHITYNVNASSKPHFCKAFNLPQVQAASP